MSCGELAKIYHLALQQENHTKLITTFPMATTQLTKGTQDGKTQSSINWTTPNTSGEDKHTSQCSSTADDATENF